VEVGHLADNFNPNHDDKGRFSSDDSGGFGPFVDPRKSMGLSLKHDTKTHYTDEKGKWSPARVAAVHQPVYDKIRQGVDKAPDGKPILYMSGGGYGSGKSTLLEKFPGLVGFPPNHNQALHIDPDTIKSSIP